MAPPDLIEIPGQMPVMVLPCTLFPHCVTPLFIFEPRYRKMLQMALESDRFFCIGTCDPEADSDDDDREVHPISTAGVIRACVTHDNGTSHLLLLGTRRIRLVDWLQQYPFRIATVETIEAEVESPSLADRLAEETIDLAESLAAFSEGMSNQVRDHLKTLQDPSAVADVVADSFVKDPRQRQMLLEACEVSERLHLLTQLLQARLTEGK